MAQKAATGVWGIDLGQCALKALRVEMIDGEVTATAYDYIEYPKILSQPDADPDELTREALNKFLSRNTLRGDAVVISVPGQSGLARFVKLPPVEEKKIGDIVRFEAKQQIPFPLEEVVWDFQKLGSGAVTDGYALETEIGLFAMKRDMVNRYLQHFKDVNVEINIVQMAPLALCNFVAHDLLNKGSADTGGSTTEEEDEGEDEEGSGKKKCVVALDIGTDNSNLVITDGERIIWQRPIPIGGNHFTRALTKDLKLTFAKAEHLKRNAMKSPDLKKILGALRPVLNDFVSEVQRSLGYFTNTHRDAHIKYMIGLGNAFRLPGLQKFLQEKLQIDVRKLQKIRRLGGESVTSAPQFTENILSFAVAEGLALQGLKMTRLQTNLLPQEIQFERMVRAKKPWALAAVALLLLATGVLAFARGIESAAVNDPQIKKALDTGKTHMDTASKFEAEVDQLETATKTTHDTVLRVAAGVNERYNWNLLYKYINDAVPMPDGKHLADTTRINARVRDSYFSDRTAAGKKGKEALDMLKQRKLALSQERTPTRKDAEDDETVKRDLVSINIEGITPMYCDDMKLFAEYIKKKRNFKVDLLKQNGMAGDEANQLINKADELKDAGWVVEIRGYTYHYDRQQFVIRTLVENLAYPEGLYPSKQLPKNYPANLKSQVRDRVKYVFLDDFDTDSNPQSGEFRLIKNSNLRVVLGMEGTGGGDGMKQPRKGGMDTSGDKTGETKGPTRDGWEISGKVATESLGTAGKNQPGMFGKRPDAVQQSSKFGMPGMKKDEEKEDPRVGLVLTPRTEFVLYFVWLEPLTPEAAEKASEKK